MLGDIASSCWGTLMASANLLARYSSRASGLSWPRTRAARPRGRRAPPRPVAERQLISARLPAPAAVRRDAGSRLADLAGCRAAGPADRLDWPCWLPCCWPCWPALRLALLAAARWPGCAAGCCRRGMEMPAERAATARRRAAHSRMPGELRGVGAGRSGLPGAPAAHVAVAVESAAAFHHEIRRGDVPVHLGGGVQLDAGVPDDVSLGAGPWRRSRPLPSWLPRRPSRRCTTSSWT